MTGWSIQFAAVLIGGITALGGLASAEPAQKTTPSSTAFTSDVRPILSTYCYRCHGGEKTKGDLNLLKIASSTKVMEEKDVWKSVAGRLGAHEMPPEKAKQPTDEERKKILQWCSAFGPPGEADCQQIATDKTSRFYRGYVMSRRLTRVEYNNTIRDLVGQDLHVGDLLPQDSAGGEGFDNNGDTLYSSPILVEKYLKAADRVVEWAFTKGDLKRILGDTAEARNQLDFFMEKAFRRPISQSELDRYWKLYQRGGMKLAMKGILVSPYFLFLVEEDPGKEGIYPLGDYPLASRLSYFLWASMPDAQLLSLARQGKLQNEEVLRAQVHRMLQDPKAKSFAANFASQWLGIEDIGTSRRPDARRFPEFDDELAQAELAEPTELLAFILHNDKSLLDLLDCNYTFLNQRLAALYGIPNVQGNQMRRVELSDLTRGGVVSMAAILTETSYPLRTSPVLRGKWVLEQLLGTHIPPPPPTAGKLPPDDATRDGLTFRQQLEQHRSNPECASCHSKMDPLGFGLENFDPIGRWRSNLNGQPIDSSGKLPSGQSFQGPAQLKEVLLKHKDEFLRTFSRKMLGYALGRGLNRFDQCVIDDAMKKLAQNNNKASVLIEEIVLSKPFRYRFSAK